MSDAYRAKTVRAAVRPDAKPADIVQPGHIFPLMAQNGGVLVRAGHTEAGCDLTALAGLEPAAVICEILKEDGEMARLPDLLEFAAHHRLKIGTIADLIHYRSQTERLVERVAERTVHTASGEFRLLSYHDKTAHQVHLALVKGDIDPTEDTLVRVHEPLSVLDLLDRESRIHSWSVQHSMECVARAGKGVIVLMHRPESTDDLLERLQQPDDAPRQPLKVALRDYGIGAQILKDLNVGKMRLLAVPRKMPSMTGFDLEVTGYLLPEEEEYPNAT
jgi:3,4-dihydroxy 2-butanone 4-phosphate synthase/GTP cyclohydrolase II